MTLLIRPEQYGPADKSGAALVGYYYWESHLSQHSPKSLECPTQCENLNLNFQVLVQTQRET